MRILLWLVLLCTFEMAAETDLGRRVWVAPLSEHTWRIRSVSEFEGFGQVESNAVLIAGPHESILLDTPASVDQTEAVLAWAEGQLHRPVRHLIVTHGHADRMGGIDAAAPRKITTYALARTIELARQHHLTPPERELPASGRLTLAGMPFEVFYPGHGHTEDNLVVWIAQDGVLHGGCFVKSASAANLGNLQEINIPSWRAGVAAVQKRYGTARIVVPGHGAIGGPELLAHTAQLLEAAL